MKGKFATFLDKEENFDLQENYLDAHVGIIPYNAKSKDRSKSIDEPSSDTARTKDKEMEKEKSISDEQQAIINSMSALEKKFQDLEKQKSMKKSSSYLGSINESGRVVKNPPISFIQEVKTSENDDSADFKMTWNGVTKAIYSKHPEMQS